MEYMTPHQLDMIGRIKIPIETATSLLNGDNIYCYEDYDLGLIKDIPCKVVGGNAQVGEYQEAMVMVQQDVPNSFAGTVERTAVLLKDSVIKKKFYQVRNPAQQLEHISNSTDITCPIFNSLPLYLQKIARPHHRPLNYNMEMGFSDTRFHKEFLHSKISTS